MRETLETITVSDDARRHLRCDGRMLAGTMPQLVDARPQLTATYRLQLNAGFTLAMARERVDYFARLGVSHLYLSPILAARRGSMHGYDVVDPTRVNPELGTEDDFARFPARCTRGAWESCSTSFPTTWVSAPRIRYWDDVLAHGERSRYRDVVRHRLDSRGHPRRSCFPSSATSSIACIERGELAVRRRRHAHASPRVCVTTAFPIDPASLPPELQLAQFDPRRDRRARAIVRAARGSRAAARAARAAALSTGVLARAVRARSTTAASSTSTTWRRCASRIPQSSTRRTRSSSRSCATA